MSVTNEAELVAYIDQAKSDAIHAFQTLSKNGTLSASLTFHITHRIPDSFPWWFGA
jgi:L-ribulose-5-phosphate 4-epimerase